MEFLISKSATGYHSHSRDVTLKNWSNSCFSYFCIVFLIRWWICLFVSFLFISFFFFFHLSFAFTRRIHTIEQRDKNLNRKTHTIWNRIRWTQLWMRQNTQQLRLAWSKNCVCWDIVKIEQRANDKTTRRIHVFLIFNEMNNPKRANAFGGDTSLLQDEKGQVHLL